ncbi:MAG: hypothetical protein IPJ65_17200 [Archangiaceae bacterium]|nr:hypothetical protein [Archangiaceae bacterium]
MSLGRTLLVLALVGSTAAWAQRKKDDAPLPYDEQGEDDDKRRDLPRRSDATSEPAPEPDVESKGRRRSLASLDDPNIGLSLEVVGAALLLDSSRGQTVEGLGLGGIRVTWEWSRTFLTDEFWREIFFLDLTWFASRSSGPGGFGGTTEIFDSVNYHYFTLAPAFAFPLGKTPLAVYGQVGGGVNYQTSSIFVQSQDSTNISAVRFVLQYGLGLRARIHFISEESFRENGYTGIPCLSVRLELTRFRRAYMDDTVIGGSVGITF